MIQYVNKNDDKLKLVNNKLVVEISHHGEYTTEEEPVMVSWACWNLIHDAIEKANKWDQMMNLISGIKY